MKTKIKKILTLIIFGLSPLLISTFIFAQVPAKMSYQSVVRDIDGALVTNSPVGIKIQILQGSSEGVAVYAETHKVFTNANGLATLEIGGGKVVSGSFDNIEWGQGIYFLKTETDPKGGTNYTITGASQFLSVPYAFVAGKLVDDAFAGDDKGGNGPGVPSQVWSLFGNSNSNPATDKLGTTDYKDLVIVTNNLERLRILANGDIKFSKNLEVGEDLTVKKNVYLNSVSGQTINKGNFTVSNSSSTLLTGTLTVDMAADLNNTLNVDGATDLNSSLDVNNTSPTHLSGILNVDGTTDLNGALDVNNAFPTHLSGILLVDGVTDLNSSLNVNNISPTHLSGLLDVDKSLHVGGLAYIESFLLVDGVTDLANTLNVTASSNYVANFINTTSASGINIQIAATTPSSANQFITFRDNSGNTVGRIEGQTLSELQNSFDYIFNNTLQTLQAACAIGEIACALDVVDLCAGGCAAVAFAAESAQWYNSNTEAENNVGVSYQSGSGDYAEWLEKDSNTETFSYGDIVGVKGGKISKSMTEPDQYLVVSKSPIVLGNMPAEGAGQNYEKIAFLGQVPVKVRGEVKIGDYILVSDLRDGFGIAVDPKEITLDQYKRIVGVAWSSSVAGQVSSMVNVAVGMNTSNFISEIQKQNEELASVKSQLNTVLEYLQSKDATFNPSLFDIPVQTAEQKVVTSKPAAISTTTISNTKQNINDMITMLKDNPDLLTQIMIDAKQALDKKGINYNKFEQTTKMVTDPSYYMEVLSEMYK